VESISQVYGTRRPLFIFCLLVHAPEPSLRLEPLRFGMFVQYWDCTRVRVSGLSLICSRRQLFGGTPTTSIHLVEPHLPGRSLFSVLH
jgi:hypothetical protein